MKRQIITAVSRIVVLAFAAISLCGCEYIAEWVRFEYDGSIQMEASSVEHEFSNRAFTNLPEKKFVGYEYTDNQNLITNNITLYVGAYAADDERIVIYLNIFPALLKFIGINSYDNKEMYGEVYEMNKKYIVDLTKENTLIGVADYARIRASYKVNGCEYNYKATQGWFKITNVRQEEDKKGLFISGEFAFTAVDENSGDVLTVENGRLDNFWLYTCYNSIDFDNCIYEF